jgi:hypothetical protein
MSRKKFGFKNGSPGEAYQTEFFEEKNQKLFVLNAFSAPAGYPGHLIRPTELCTQLEIAFLRGEQLVLQRGGYG